MHKIRKIEKKITNFGKGTLKRATITCMKEHKMACPV